MDIIGSRCSFRGVGFCPNVIDIRLSVLTCVGAGVGVADSIVAGESATAAVELSSSAGCEAPVSTVDERRKHLQTHRHVTMERMERE